MASCNVSTLLVSGAAFQALSDTDLKIAKAQLIRQWLGSSPTPETLLTNGKDFMALSDFELQQSQIKLLCNILGI